MNDDQFKQMQAEITEVLERHGVNNDQGVALLLTSGAYLGAHYHMTCKALLSTTALAYDLATKRPDAKERADERFRRGRSSLFERADLHAVLDDIQARVDAYAKDHVSAPDGVKLRVELTLTSEGAKLASWWLEDERGGPLV